MMLLELPTEIRLQIWSTCVEIFTPANAQNDQICTRIDGFCGQRYHVFSAPLIPFLSTNRQIYVEISNLLNKMAPRHTLRFCSPGCIVNIIPRLNGFQLAMTRGLEMYINGTWGVPVEAVHGIRSTILGHLQDADEKQRKSRGLRERKEGDSWWEMSFGEQRGWVSPIWVLEFHRTPP